MRKLGVCYYPEHWSRLQWASDARRMAELGVSRVRIGEFAWGRIEPQPGVFDWSWLDEAIATLGAQKLEVVLGTPTATPPKWLVDEHPDILAVDQRGQPRRFGSRRHYDFSSERWRAESQRIVTAVAERYGRNPHVVAWQIDNEYGCHSTVLSYSPSAVARFRNWLAERYGSVAALNQAWGNVFWSMEYRSFEEIDAPILTVTETNPCHRLDYQRFASDEVVRYNRMQAEILRACSPDRDIVHNFMGFFTEFDHHRVAQDLDVASWDSYPLGATEVGPFSESVKQTYLRTGHPDVTGWNHDLYRGMCNDRFWVMEQQPGPVNWAPWNVSPLPGMVRFWTWEAFAHGAEVVSYFRWRQCPFAQEQMHSGLNTPDDRLDQGGREVAQVAQELCRVPETATSRAPVAMLFDYHSLWALELQPQGADYNPVQLHLEYYSALRELGLDVDILSPSADLRGYRLIVAPIQAIADPALAERLGATGAQIVLGPRSGAKTPSFTIPANLPPGPLTALLPVRVWRVESLRPGSTVALQGDGLNGYAHRWREMVEAPEGAVVSARFADGHPAVIAHGRGRYFAGWFDPATHRTLLARAAEAAGIETRSLPAGLRLRRRGEITFAFNYGPSDIDIPLPEGASLLVGTRRLVPAAVAAWSERAAQGEEERK